MKDLRPRIKDDHRAAFGTCPFRHYVELGPIPVDRPTLAIIVKSFDEKSNEPKEAEVSLLVHI